MKTEAITDELVNGFNISIEMMASQICARKGANVRWSSNKILIWKCNMRIYVFLQWHENQQHIPHCILFLLHRSIRHLSESHSIFLCLPKSCLRLHWSKWIKRKKKVFVLLCNWFLIKELCSFSPIRNARSQKLSIHLNWTRS